MEKVTPDRKQRKRVLHLADELVNKVTLEAEKEGIDAEVRIEGSVAKDTWLSEEPDIDIFMRVPSTLPRETLGTICLRIARKATHGSEQVERFAEHPYLEVTANGIRVNIVPCYRVRQGSWISATDRTPFHTDYAKPLLNESLRGEVRLLKRFMKGISVYGAEIKVGGFSGYLCELLILHYGSFAGVLKAMANWQEQRIIDIEGHYREREEEVRMIFEEPFVVVDPIDKGRNVAAAVRKEKLDELITASREFLKEPSQLFFYPETTRPLDTSRLVNVLRTRGSTLVFVKLENASTIPDILWGQLYKSQRFLRKILQQHDFRIIRDMAWSSGEDISILTFEVEQHILPLVKKHWGPPITKQADCRKFLEKHIGASQTLSGPYIEDGRWVVETRRKQPDVVKLLTRTLRIDKKHTDLTGLYPQISFSDSEVLINEEVMEFYSINQGFAMALTEYLRGKPIWLR
ncbi:MAG: CCA tRNA nucleotidyltransferase [Candidatus Bathyarchaeota archaeon]|nr:MAG: CCA tRNA nucleotidyltransferase [Candidatus Bathyarchaeota archaeon]